MTKRVLLGVLVGLLAACGQGGSDNAIRTVISGQQMEARLQSSRCYYVGSTGSLFGGGILSPLQCQLAFRSQGVYADEVAFTVTDVPSVYQYYIDTWLPVDNQLISVTVRLQGQNVAVLTGSFIFSRISNVAGGPVCGEFELTIGTGSGGLITGSFCTNVDAGL